MHPFSPFLCSSFFLLGAGRFHITLPAVREASFNVAVAGSIVMYDRLAKSRAQEKAAAKRGGGEEAERKRKLKSLSKGNFPGRTRKGI